MGEVKRTDAQIQAFLDEQDRTEVMAQIPCDCYVYLDQFDRVAVMLHGTAAHGGPTNGWLGAPIGKVTGNQSSLPRVTSYDYTGKPGRVMHLGGNKKSDLAVRFADGGWLLVAVADCEFDGAPFCG